MMQEAKSLLLVPSQGPIPVASSVRYKSCLSAGRKMTLLLFSQLAICLAAFRNFKKSILNDRDGKEKQKSKSILRSIFVDLSPARQVEG